MKLPKEFYTRPNVVQIAQELLGKHIYTAVDGMLTGGMIVETEAYSGENDRACHAHLGRRTNRTEIMYHEGGVAYVYLVYGIYNLFNIITNVEGKADAVLIRAIQPEIGTEEMLLRRNMPTIKSKIPDLFRDEPRKPDGLPARPATIYSLKHWSTSAEKTHPYPSEEGN